MHILFGFGFTTRLAAGCLVCGFLLGLVTCSATADHAAAREGAAVTDSRPLHRQGPVPGEEVTSWSRTSTSSCSAGS